MFFRLRKEESPLLTVDYYAQLSGISHWNSVFKILFALAALILTVASDSILFALVVLISMSLISLLAGKAPPRIYFLPTPDSYAVRIGKLRSFAVSYCRTFRGTRQHPRFFPIMYASDRLTCTAACSCFLMRSVQSAACICSY